MIDLLSGVVENRAPEIYGRSAAFEAETPSEPSWIVPIKINNASIYKAQISPQKPRGRPGAKPPADHSREADGEEGNER